jgi:hypothetical protein
MMSKKVIFFFSVSLPAPEEKSHKGRPAGCMQGRGMGERKRKRGERGSHPSILGRDPRLAHMAPFFLGWSALYLRLCSCRYTQYCAPRAPCFRRWRSHVVAGW